MSTTPMKPWQYTVLPHENEDEGEEEEETWMLRAGYELTAALRAYGFHDYYGGFPFTGEEEAENAVLLALVALQRKSML